MQLNNNSQLIINQPNVIWRIQTGILAISVVAKGYHRHLFNVKPGEVVISSAPLSEAQSCQLVAKPIEDTILEPLTYNDYQVWLQTSPEQALATLHQWLNNLVGILANPVPMTLPTPIGTSGVLETEEILQVQQGQNYWIRITLGTAQLWAQPALTVTPELSWMPLASSSWIMALERVELECCDSAIELPPYQLIQGVLSLQLDVQVFQRPIE
jgi:hypothetical protein